MKELVIVSIIAALLFSCRFNSSKTTADEIQHSSPGDVLNTFPKLNSADSLPDHPFRLTIHEGSNWNIKIDSISENEFDQTSKEIYQQKKVDGDSLMTNLSRRFNEVIILSDSCCILKGWDSDITLCNTRPPDNRGWTGYKGVDYDHGFLILTAWEYESGSYISFNPATRQYIYTSNEPRFITDNLIYSAGNYYGEGQFQINDLEEDEYFGFESFHWTLTGFYQHENSIFMEFTLNDRRRYLRAEFN